LHSGDLRKVGDERFAITEDQPAGEPAKRTEEDRKKSSLIESSQDHSVNTLDEGTIQVTVNRLKDGGVMIADKDGNITEYNAAFAKDKSDADLLKYLYEPVGHTESTPIVKESAGVPKDPKATRADFKEAIDINEAKRMGLETQAEEAARVGNESRVTSINEQIKVLEQEHAQLIKDMPSQETLAYERSDVQEYADRHSTTTESTKEAFVDWLHKSEMPLDPAKIGEYEKQFMADVETPKEKILKEKPSTKGVFSEKQIKDAGGFILPLKVAAKRGDGGMSPWLMADGKIVTTGQDHIAFADQFVEETSDKGYSDFMNQTGAIRAAMFEDVSGKYVVTLHMAEGQKPTKEQIKVLEDIEKERGKPITVLVGNKDGMVNPEYTPTTLEQLKKDVGTTRSVDELATKTSEPVAKEFEKLDPRSMPSEEAMLNHATDIYERYGEADAIKFFEDYKKNLNERSIPIPNDGKGLDDMLHKMNTYVIKDRSEMVVWVKAAKEANIDPKQAGEWFFMLEDGKELPPEAKKWLQEGQEELVALVRKGRAMGLEIGEEFATGQSRVRLFSEKEKPGWKDTIKKFFSNDTPMGDKIADQADAAIERKVYQLDDGRVVEIHRQSEDVKTPKRDIKKGTEIWEWKNGDKKLIGHTDDLQFKLGDKVILRDGKEATMVTGNVRDIEQHSTYKYSHDPFLSQALARMGLRKMVREAEAVENLKKSELFKQVGHGPDQPLKDLPKGWVVPSNIDRIPQLRGWHFDPKTAAIISDFAKVWDNTMYMKLSNALVKNMMLNPIPHMFNEVMHLWNARGFTGWVDPRRLGMFADTARVAWRDVGNQTQFYRDIMREGGSILGADPRNKNYFDTIQKEASKQMFGTPEMQRSMTGLAKKLGTSVGDLYNGISDASQKAMWFTRDVMYVQLVREIMARQEKSGNKMTLKEAIDQAERHMPNYRLPSEVLGSRAVSQVLRDPRISMFSRYHYGMVKSLVNTIKDVNPNNLKTPEGRAHFREGVDSMLAIGVAMGVMYPLMDAMAEAVFGEGAEQRRAGPYHLLQAGLDFTTGKKDASALIWPVFTFNPVALTLGQLGLNKKIFTGKEIYHPDDDFMDKASDVAGYAAGQIPQASPLMSAAAEEGGATKFLARQLDIKAKTPEQIAREERAKARQERVKKGRDTKRDKGTYKP
jgi:predicted transcriptional regulator